MVGAVSLPACESMKNAPPKYRTVEQLVISSTVSSHEYRVSQTVAAPCTKVGSVWKFRTLRRPLAIEHAPAAEPTAVTR